MVVRILVVAGLIVLGAGFVFFAGNVIWLGTREFFKIYGPKDGANCKHKKNNVNIQKENN